MRAPESGRAALISSVSRHNNVLHEVVNSVPFEKQKCVVFYLPLTYLLSSEFHKSTTVCAWWVHCMRGIQKAFSKGF